MGAMRSRDDAVRRYRDAFGYHDAVQELEALIARAWPPLLFVEMGGWQVRSARGCSWLANSVWPRGDRPGPPLEARLGNVERFYTARGLDPCFQIGPAPAPRHLDRVLAGRGYAPTTHIEVRTGRLDLLAEHTDGAEAVTLDTEPTPDWLEAWAGVGDPPARQPDVATAVMRRVGAPSAYATLAVDGTDVAVARGVVDGGYLGVHSLGAIPAYRHPAVGRALLGELGRWATGLGAVQAYVPVGEGASPLADTSGLRRAYRYRFRILRAPALRPVDPPR